MPKTKPSPEPEETEEQEAPAGKGHNVVTASKLKEMVERIESLIEDRKAVNDDLRQVMAEADLLGFDKRTLKEVVKLRALDPNDRTEREELRDMYLRALGLL